MTLGWKLIGRDVYLDPPSIGGSVRVCDEPAFQWVESLSQNSAEGCIHVAIGNSNYAPYGAFSASRASDGGGIGHMALAYQDKTVESGGVWAHYSEVFVKSDAAWANTAFGHEYAITNKRASCGDITPNQISNWGMVDGIRVGVGKPGDNGQEISSLMTFVNVEQSATAKARKGLVFDKLVLKLQNLLGRAFGEVLALAPFFGFRWYDSNGNPSSTIACDDVNAAYAPHIRFTNGAIHFVGKGGFNQFSFNTETGVLYLGNESWNPRPLPQCPGSVGTVTFYVGGREMEMPCYPARS